MENAIACKYLKEVKRNLPAAVADKRKFLADFRENLEAFLQEKPDANQEDLVRRFGSPETIAESFLPEAPAGEALRTEKQKKLRKRILILFFIVCAVLLIGLVTFRVWDRYNFYHGHSVTTGGEGSLPNHTDAFGIY